MDTPCYCLTINIDNNTRVYSLDSNNIYDVLHFIREMDGVNAVQTLIGGGGIRYMLTYTPQSPNSAYGQLLVRTILQHLLSIMQVSLENITGIKPQTFGKIKNY